MPIVLDCDPGHDDAIAILLALACPEVELRGVTTVAGNQTLEKTTATRSSCSSSPAAPTCRWQPALTAPLRADLRVAAHVHGESGLDGPSLPEPTSGRRRARGRLPRRADRARRRARPDRAADERRAHARAPPRRARPPRADRLDGWGDRGGQRDARCGVQHLRRSRRRRPRCSERDPASR